MLEIAHNKYFPDGMPTASMIATTAGDFRIVGELMAMSIVQGGPAPSFLSPIVYTYLCREPLSPQCNNETKDIAIRVGGLLVLDYYPKLQFVFVCLKYFLN